MPSTRLALTTVGAVIVFSWAAFLLMGGAFISLLWQGQGPTIFRVPQEIVAVYAPADLWLWLASAAPSCLRCC